MITHACLSSRTIAGAYKYFDVDISAALKSGPQTGAVLAVEVSRSYDQGLDCKDTVPPNERVACRNKTKLESQDLGITWVDWAPVKNTPFVSFSFPSLLLPCCHMASPSSHTTLKFSDCAL